jgi:hypothetical protein
MANALSRMHAHFGAQYNVRRNNVRRYVYFVARNALGG